jgi:hypothetical protein
MYREVQHVSVIMTLDLFQFSLGGALKESLHIRCVLKLCLKFIGPQLASNASAARTLQGNASECFVSQEHCFDTSSHNS